MVMLHDQNTMNIQPQERKKKKHEKTTIGAVIPNIMTDVHRFPLYNIV